MSAVAELLEIDRQQRLANARRADGGFDEWRVREYGLVVIQRGPANQNRSVSASATESTPKRPGRPRLRAAR